MSAPSSPAPLRALAAARSAVGRALGPVRSPRRPTAARWRRRQALLAAVLAVHAALLAAASALMGEEAVPELVVATTVVMALLGVCAAPLLAPSLPVPRPLAATAAGAGLALSALALGGPVAGLPPTVTTAHLLVVVVLTAVHRATVPVLAVALTALAGRLLSPLAGVPAPAGAETAAELVALTAAGAVALVSWRREARPAATAGALVRSTDRDGLRTLLATHLGEHAGEPLALLLVALVPAEGRDGAGAEADDVLHAVTARAAGAVRDGDVVVRLPEDHLAVLLPGGTAASARRVGERVRAALSEGVVVAGALLDLETSVGAGGSPQPHPDGVEGSAAAERAAGTRGAAATADRLLAQVDAALEVARDTGTGVAVVDPDAREGARLADLAVLREQLRGGLGDAVPRVDTPDGGGLALRWQPRFDVRTGRWTTATARLAWADDEPAGPGGRRRPCPAELAAGTTLAPDLVHLLLRRALDAAAGWRRDGLRVQAAVAVPGEALGRPGLVDLVGAALQEVGADPVDLRLLVADADVVADPAAAAVAVDRLTALGVAVSVTGVGASRSSVAALGALAVDEVVVDPALVRPPELGGGEDVRLLRAVVGLGHGLGLRVVAAGVDEAAAHRGAVALGADAVEGLHVAGWTTTEGIASLVVRGDGGDLLTPAPRPTLPAPRRPEST